MAAIILLPVPYLFSDVGCYHLHKVVVCVSVHWILKTCFYRQAYEIFRSLRLHYISKAFSSFNNVTVRVHVQQQYSRVDHMQHRRVCKRIFNLRLRMLSIGLKAFLHISKFFGRANVTTHPVSKRLLTNHFFDQKTTSNIRLA